MLATHNFLNRYLAALTMIYSYVVVMQLKHGWCTLTALNLISLILMCPALSFLRQKQDVLGRLITKLVPLDIVY